MISMTGTAPSLDRSVDLGFVVDVPLTLAPLRHGWRDPTMRFDGAAAWRGMRTEQGAATLCIAAAGSRLRVIGWGPGAEAAAAMVPRLLGAEDDPAALRLPDGPLRELARRFEGLRFGRSDDVMGSLVPAIIEQKVTGEEARRSYRGLVLRYGEKAPGPAELWLAPTAERLATLPAWQLHDLGLEARRATTIVRAAARAAWLQAGTNLPREMAMARLRSIRGVGAWTAAETARSAFGDPDAVSVGDFHTPSLVSWWLAGEPRADDARMLELLEPFRGQRARLVRLLEVSGVMPPRYGPRMRVRSIARI
jgi:3-methyladenine DNA glycosylase/8-oxoguanine DNA glycosylase